MATRTLMQQKVHIYGHQSGQVQACEKVLAHGYHPLVHGCTCTRAHGYIGTHGKHKRRITQRSTHKIPTQLVKNSHRTHTDTQTKRHTNTHKHTQTKEQTNERADRHRHRHRHRQRQRRRPRKEGDGERQRETERDREKDGETERERETDRHVFRVPLYKSVSKNKRIIIVFVGMQITPHKTVMICKLYATVLQNTHESKWW